MDARKAPHCPSLSVAHPNTAMAAAVAIRTSSGVWDTKAATRAVREQPAAVTSVSISIPLCTSSTRVPSVTCRVGAGTSYKCRVTAAGSYNVQVRHGHQLHVPG